MQAGKRWYNFFCYLIWPIRLIGFLKRCCKDLVAPTHHDCKNLANLIVILTNFQPGLSLRESVRICRLWFCLLNPSDIFIRSLVLFKMSIFTKDNAKFIVLRITLRGSPECYELPASKNFKKFSETRSAVLRLAKAGKVCCLSVALNELYANWIRQPDLPTQRLIITRENANLPLIMPLIVQGTNLKSRFLWPGSS